MLVSFYTYAISAFQGFEKDRTNNIPPILEDYIKQIARNGRTMLPWIYIKPLILRKYNKVVDEFVNDSVTEFITTPGSSSIIELRQRVYDTLKRMDGIPFTIQRICELFESPLRHYSRPDKYLRGLEKVCMVVSTVDPQGNKILSEDPRFPSQAGLEECGLMNSDTLMSPPSSPSIDSLNTQRTSKSSDEDVTDEDENEEEEDNEAEEAGSSGETQPSPESANTPISRPPLLSSPTASWPFGIDGAAETIRPTISPPSVAPELYAHEQKPTHLSPGAGQDPRPHCVASEADDKDVEMSVSATVDSSSLSPKRPKISHDDKLPFDSEVSSSPDRASDAPTTIDVREDQFDVIPSGPDAQSSEGGDSTTDTEGDEDESLSDSSESSAHSIEVIGESKKISGNKEAMPPIGQLLRPIGQLEAFVQNVTSEVATSLADLQSDSSTKSNPTEVILPHINQSIAEGAHLDIIQDSVRSPVPGEKRRAVSPKESDELRSGMSSSECPGANELESTLHHESPAKRRRLVTDPHVIESDLSVTDSSSHRNLPSSTLNDSPPIILCNPQSQNSDKNSGEHQPPPVLAQSEEETGHTDYQENSPSAESNVETAHPEGTNSTTTQSERETTAESFGHINKETGEEEA
ncbi:unnamed protein product [Calicophoron daubneyi]|uniref:Serine/threonine-protein phosphatase 4 regulatory subunit 2 n=1 Tax=Calicophoron daubneyi TaxID=300641 RepID=A0AAV2TDF8_CALDB